MVQACIAALTICLLAVMSIRANGVQGRGSIAGAMVARQIGQLDRAVVCCSDLHASAGPDHSVGYGDADYFSQAETRSGRSRSPSDTVDRPRFHRSTRPASVAD